RERNHCRVDDEAIAHSGPRTSQRVGRTDGGRNGRISLYAAQFVVIGYAETRVSAFPTFGPVDDHGNPVGRGVLYGERFGREAVDQEREPADEVDVSQNLALP